MAYQIYTKGVKENKMPEPYNFMWGSMAMGLCALLNIFDSRVGTALAWAVLIGATIANQTKGKAATGSATA
jgi:hypothetical protein